MTDPVLLCDLLNPSEACFHRIRVDSVCDAKGSVICRGEAEAHTISGPRHPDPSLTGVPFSSVFHIVSTEPARWLTVGKLWSLLWGKPQLR